MIDSSLKVENPHRRSSLDGNVLVLYSHKHVTLPVYFPELCIICFIIMKYQVLSLFFIL